MWETEQTCDISSYLECGKLSRLVILLLADDEGNLELGEAALVGRGLGGHQDNQDNDDDINC